MIGLPPSFGAVHDTEALPLPGLAVTDVGVAGAVAFCPIWMKEATDEMAPRSSSR